MDSAAARIRHLAELKRHNASTLGQTVGVSKSSAALYWAGKRPWPTETLHLLADELQTTVDYLLGRTDDSGLLEFRGSPAQFDEVVEIRQKGMKGQNSDADDMVEIAQIDLRYGLGGAFVDENAIESEPRRFSRQWLRTITSSPPDMLFWTTGRGDSMATTIADGEVVLGDRSQTDPRDDDLIWACVLGEIGMIKRLRIRSDHVKILSDNPLVPEDTAYPDDNLRIVGRIIAVVHRV